jgi:hypothetical protein
MTNNAMSMNISTPGKPTDTSYTEYNNDFE